MYLSLYKIDHVLPSLRPSYVEGSFPSLISSPVPSPSSSSSVVTLQPHLLWAPHPTPWLEVAVLFPTLCLWLEWRGEWRQVGSRRRGE